jgi:hypothetical protein
MNVFLTTQLSVPISQVVLLLGLSTLALIFGRMKLALLINYCFTLYWGYLSHLELFAENGVLKFDNFSFTYLGFGLAILIMALISFAYYQD